MTNKQIEMARHVLGLPNDTNIIYRNYYCVSKNDDGYKDWEDMVIKDFAAKVNGGTNWIGDLFHLTLKGIQIVLLPKEHISQEDAVKMRHIIEE